MFTRNYLKYVNTAYFSLHSADYPLSAEILDVPPDIALPYPAMHEYPVPNRRIKWPLSNPHFHQLYQVLRLRKAPEGGFEKSFEAPGGLAYDVELHVHPSNEKRDLALVVHGLAASSKVAHVQGMIGSFFKAGYDAAGLNLPGCGRLRYPSKRRYHFADTDALDDFVRWAADQDKWNNIYLIGFSLGGSIVIHYLSGGGLPSIIAGGAAISVPLSLPEFYARIHERQNRIYEKSFILALGFKELLSAGFGSLQKIRKIDDLLTYDSVCTLPGTDFRSMKEYAEKASPREQLAYVKRPLLLLNALDDTFLGPESFPKTEDIANDLVHIAYLERGGHCGFKEHLFTDTHLSEEIALGFFSDEVPTY